MAVNPLQSQGVINRLIASVSVVNFPVLNVTPSFLGKAAITLALEGEITTQIMTLTGAVQSPEPYQPARVVMHLLKSQPLANLYKQQIEANSLIGDIVVRSDSPLLGAYQLTNCSIRAIAELNFSGEDAGFNITLGGYYNINANLWQPA